MVEVYLSKLRHQHCPHECKHSCISNKNSNRYTKVFIHINNSKQPATTIFQGNNFSLNIREVSIYLQILLPNYREIFEGYHKTCSDFHT